MPSQRASGRQVTRRRGRLIKAGMTMGASVADVSGKRSAHEGLHQQIRAEFLEMPGLKVTLRQAARLWNIDVATCESVLGALVEEGFLSHSARDAFRRYEG